MIEPMSQPDNFNQIALDSAARIVRFLDDLDRAYDRRRESGNPLGESDNPDVKAYCWPGWDRERVIASIIMAEMAREEIEARLLEFAATGILPGEHEEPPTP